MIIDKIGGHTIERYNSIENLPIPRFMNFNRLLMLDSGIGSDHESIDKHDMKIIMFAQKGDMDKVIQEVMNRNQCQKFIMDHVSPKNMSYAVTVHSIDGDIQYDYSDDSCKRIVERLGSWGTTQSWLGAAIESLRKKLEAELDDYFPGRFDSPDIKEMYSKRKKRTQLLLNIILNKASETVNAEIEKIDDYLYKLINPMNYAGQRGAESKYITAYEEMSFILSQHTNQLPKKMTTMEYFQAWEIVKKQMKSKTKR